MRLCPVEWHYALLSSSSGKKTKGEDGDQGRSINGDKSLHVHCPKPGGMTTLNAMEGWVWYPGYEFPKGELQTSRWPAMSDIGNVMSLS